MYPLASPAAPVRSIEDVPDEPPTEPERPSGDRSEAHPPLPRDKRGWQVSPAPDGRGMPEHARPARRRTACAGFWWFVLALIALNWLSVLFFQPSTGEQRVTVPFSPYFLEQVKAGHGQLDLLQGRHDRGQLQGQAALPASDTKATPTKLFATQVPSFWNGSQLSALLQEKGVQINAESTTTSTVAAGRDPARLRPDAADRRPVRPDLPSRREGAGGMGALGNFGRSQARRVDPEKIRVTFDDVAGIDEAKAELSEIVDFLRNPERYGRLGGRMPHGVLLSGAPGTGKTLLARAVAGEAHAAFFSISASEFIEAIVGVGAARVRDLFAKAKEAAPAIIFIDELDAIGRSRQGSVSVTGANDEREQTLDQILTEIDGFESSAGGGRAGRDQPPRRPRPGAAARRALRPARDRAGARPQRARRNPQGPHPLDPARPTTSTSTRSPSSTPGHGRRGPRQPRQRGRAAGRPPRAREGADGRLHRLAGEDHARRPARHPALARRPRAHRLPRVRPRAGGHAHARRRPRAQGLDHPARDGARA